MTATNHAILKPDRRGRLRYSKEQKSALVEAYQASGLSGPRFAALHGVNYLTLAGWLQTTLTVRPHERSAQIQDPGRHHVKGSNPIRKLSGWISRGNEERFFRGPITKHQK